MPFIKIMQAAMQTECWLLPDFLQPQNTGSALNISAKALEEGLQLTGHFLKRRLFDLLDKDLPQPRLRLAHLVAKRYNNT